MQSLEVAKAETLTRWSMPVRSRKELRGWPIHTLRSAADLRRLILTAVAEDAAGSIDAEAAGVIVRSAVYDEIVFGIIFMQPLFDYRAPMEPFDLYTTPPYPLPEATSWGGITGDQFGDLLRKHHLSGSACARLVGANPRKVREWIGGERAVPFPHYYVLLDKINRGELTPPAQRGTA